MKRILLLIIVAIPLMAAVVFSRQLDDPTQTADPAGLIITKEAQNPWTNLNINRDDEKFQFVVVTDRTGGHRAKVFSRAVKQINLLQPEFVMSVGDLIEGYTKEEDVITREWDEFNGYLKELEMPFFYVPGNHDLTNRELVKAWNGRYGKRYYHFIYKDVLFLCMNSEDPVSAISDEQVAYFEKVLAENRNVRWTLGFLHKPLWVSTDNNRNNWAAIEKALQGRNYTIFCGHTHRYQKYIRNGMNYYNLATTGGGSRLRGPEYGELDHVVWLTMMNDGPRIANINLEGLLPDDLKMFESNEGGSVASGIGIKPVVGKVTINGKPGVNVTLRFYSDADEGAQKRWRYVADAFTDARGEYAATTKYRFDGIPQGVYRVTAVQVEGYARGALAEGNTLPAKYATPETTPLKIVVGDSERSVVNIDLVK